MKMCVIVYYEQVPFLPTMTLHHIVMGIDDGVNINSFPWRHVLPKNLVMRAIKNISSIAGMGHRWKMGKEAVYKSLFSLIIFRHRFRIIVKAQVFIRLKVKKNILIS